MSNNKCIKDANEAVASVAYKLSEMVAIYPITPSSPMAEWCDAWSAQGQKNIWNIVPDVVQMQSEGGVAGAVHGILNGGVATTTFTASQGLLLMIPNMYKIAGELTPFCMHVSARALASNGLSIFGDHSDVMAARQTGFAMLASNSVQEAHDLASIAHAATLEARVPFMHFFDGFRTSHEINTYASIDDDVLASLISAEALLAFRSRALTPDNPVIRGTAQNPDVYFQGRESVNSFYKNVPGLVLQKMLQFEKLTGRKYRLFNYYGHDEAESVIVIIGSGTETVQKTVDHLISSGKKVGVLNVHLYRPFSVADFVSVLPKTVKQIAVLDRTKEPGATAEPLCQDVQSALQQAFNSGSLGFAIPKVFGGRYGLGSKEFEPNMVNAVYDSLASGNMSSGFTVGINDDVCNTSLTVNDELDLEESGTFRAIFYGLGSDGTVGANKNTIKIIGEETNKFVQAYFVYDSKKAGAMTVSHLRFGPKPIRSPYLIRTSQFVACHQFAFLEKYDVLSTLQKGGVLLINAPYEKDQVWNSLPVEVQKVIVDKSIKLYSIDAYKVATATGMGGRINTIMQTCFFAISGILPKDEAIECIKNAIRKTYGKKGEAIIKSNFDAVDATLANLHEINTLAISSSKRVVKLNLDGAPEFVKNVTSLLLDHKGDQVPVSCMPNDGTWPTGTTCWEKRSIAQELPEWDSSLCIQCNRCVLICPHACIRAKHFPDSDLASAPSGFKSIPFKSKENPNEAFTIQLYPDDCTGCGLCSEICPGKSKSDANKKALTMVDKGKILENERINSEFFSTLSWPKLTDLKLDIKSTQFRQPLFEFSGACAGCGETPYIKLVTQLFGDRSIIANATGCSSIYGGNLPTTPYCKNAEGRGPAWANSLFEDNAEFGLGFRLAADKKADIAQNLLKSMSNELGDSFVDEILKADQSNDSAIEKQRERISCLNAKLAKSSSNAAVALLAISDFLVKKSVWIFGGDGWAYDIGFGGLDHVLASGKNVNILVLDTEVYSNTGGQQSKATPLGAVAKFAAAGKERAKKDLGLLAMMYGNVYVAQIALGANPTQTINAIAEANEYDGVSIVIAYCHCIEHGYVLKHGIDQQKLAVDSGYWPLYRFDPRRAADGENPLKLDAVDVKIPLSDYIARENRFRVLEKTNPDRAKLFLEKAQESINKRVAFYKNLAK